MSNNKQKQSLALHTTALGIGSMMMANFASAAVVTGTGFDVQANSTGVIVPGLELQNNTYNEISSFGLYTWHSEVKLVSADSSVSFSDVATGTLIGPSTAFGSTSTTVYNTHNGKYNGTSGLQNALYGFQINNGGQVNYGWADISTIDNGHQIGNYQSLTARVNAFAYSTAGESLVAGVTTPVPEPEALSLLAGGLGLVAIAAKRRRKHTADQGQRAKLAA